VTVTDEVTAVVGQHGAAVHAAAQALVTANADGFTVDVFRNAAAALEAGDQRPTAAIVRDAFATVSAAVRPPLPGARRLGAMRLLEQTGEPPPPWLLPRLATVEAAPAEPEATAPVDSSWLPDGVVPAEPEEPAAGPAPVWVPDAAAPAVVAELVSPRPRRRFRAGPWAALAVVLLLLGAGAYALTRDGGSSPSVPGPAAARPSAAEHRRGAKTGAERRAEARRARTARREAAAQRRAAVKAHHQDGVRSFVALVRRAKAARHPAAAASAPAPAVTQAPSTPVSAPAPAPTSAPAPRATSAPRQPPPSKDPPGRHAP
jgi:hypothetical protein